MRNSGNFWRRYRWFWKCVERTFLTESLIHYFRQIPDYRCGRETRHDLAEMLVCATLGFLCGRTTIRRSLKWCKAHLEELWEHMELKYGSASPSTVTRMLGGIDEELALYAFMEWIGEIADSKNTHLAIDGKTLRGATEKTKGETAPMLLNVVETVRGLILAQLPVEKDSHGNDITPTKEEFLRKGSKRIPVPSAGEEGGKDVQCTALISDLILTAEEPGSIKRMHWSIENRLHHVLDDTFREDRSPAKSPETICHSSENMHTTSCAWQCTRQA